MDSSSRLSSPLSRSASAGLSLVLAYALGPQPVAAQVADQVADHGAGATATKPWAATLELYGFLPWIQSTTTIRDLDTEAALGPGQVLNVLQAAYSFRGSVEKERLGLLLDVAYNQLGAEPSRSGPRGLVNLDTDLSAITGVYDLALRWRFGDRESAISQPGRWTVIPYAGMRMVKARLDVTAQLTHGGPLSVPLGLGVERVGSLDRSWVQPVLGTQASVFLSPRLRLFARGDIGGFGLAGAEDLSGNAQVGLGYAVGNNTDLNLSWRYQGLRWSNGAERSNGFSLDENGIEMGVKFFF